MRIAFEGVVPICSVASKNLSFSEGITLATIGVILSATYAPVLRLWCVVLVRLGNTSYTLVIPSQEIVTALLRLGKS